ncbi:MAG: CAP-associated domain-containing protein [Clostridia bacterium]
MKKTLSVLISIAILFSCLASFPDRVSAQEKYLWYAENLSKIGVFIGTGSSFELDRPPTRLEGAVMFVRLLGGEDEALMMNYPHPFRDVPEWGRGYVGYLYHYGLSNGVSTYEFGSFLEMQAKSFMTFGLRALGYTDSGTGADFSWEHALEFAYENDILDYGGYMELKNEIFLRDHVALLSYGFLKTISNGTDESLAKRLVERGFVDRAAAEEIGVVAPVIAGDLAISVGVPFIDVVMRFGLPDGVADSGFGFDWQVYSGNPDEYFEVGVKGDRVVAVLLASPGFSAERGIEVGMYKAATDSAYPEGISRIYKSAPGDATIYINHILMENRSVFRTIQNDYITYYYDSYDRDAITAIFVIDDEIEESKIKQFDIPADIGLMSSIGRQVFNLTNAMRRQKGLYLLQWDDKAAASALLHSMDMDSRDFFAHENPDGLQPWDRMAAQGISYTLAGENIAGGYRDAVHMVNDWLNSKTGHREAMLGGYLHLGVGIWIDAAGYMYGTQNYWK